MCTFSWDATHSIVVPSPARCLSATSTLHSPFQAPWHACGCGILAPDVAGRGDLEVESIHKLTRIRELRRGQSHSRKGQCGTRRKQSKPSNTQEPKQRSTQQRTTARSSADLTKPNQGQWVRLVKLYQTAVYHLNRGWY